MDPDSIPDENINGIILSIHVKNFFCHKNLFVDFSIRNNRNVFSIMGNNGSGKSTILTALVIGLGGRAISTFRGNNLQSFIKRGTNSATIEIKLKNTEPQAYRHEVYGDSITIVRTINTSGGSYKILSDSGVCISSKKTDVDAIALAHDIQVENPISVLNQDDARSFHGVNSEHKYGAFKRALNFEQTEEYYNRAQENCKKAGVILARKNEAFIELSKEFRNLKIAYDQMKTEEEIENEKQQLLTELKWFDVEKLERELNNKIGEFEECRSLHQKLAERLRATEEEYVNNTGAVESLRRRQSQPAARCEELEQRLREAKAEAQRAAEKHRLKRESRVQKCRNLEHERRHIADLMEAIRNVESERDDGGNRLEALERAKERARDDLKETTARCDTARHEEEQARQQAARAASNAESMGTELKADQKQLGRARSELQELRQHASKSLAVFGEPMIRLCELVDRAVREGRFSRPPRGPVGNFLKVRSRQWASALEHVIGGLMNQFCVNNAEDSRKLFEIMTQCAFPPGRKPGVTCSKFLSRMHDVSERRVTAPEGTCAFDALEVTDPVVANFLIDNLDLETVLLVPDHDIAVRLSSSVKNVPASCSKVVTKDCTDYMPAPRYRIYGGLERPPRYLATSTEDRTRQMEVKIAELEATVAEKTSEAAHLARQKETAQRVLDRAAKALQALQSALRERARAVKEADEALQQHSTPQLAVLKENYERSSSIVTECEKEIRKLTDNEQTLEKEKKEADRRVDEVKKELEGVTREYRSLQEETAREQLKLDRITNDKRRGDRHASDETDRLKRAEEAVERARSVLAGATEGLGRRPEPLRARSEVEGRLRLVQRQQATAPDARRRDQLRAQLHDVKERRHRVYTELHAIQELVTRIDKLTKKHRVLCYTVQTDIERHVGLKFTNILKLRNLVGHLELDHAKGELELYIDKRSTRSLSGGERSYSTMALFMAMWECVELPFYFMDEFDVFMDGVNRRTVWQLLVDFATERRGRLFVFLTQRPLPVDADATVVRRLSSAEEETVDNQSY